ncbi:MAG: hypothetical protein EBY88_08005 [Actinobacteria bacterium]|nr:hypothetical protein [Actinomycetota bacterium]
MVRSEKPANTSRAPMMLMTRPVLTPASLAKWATAGGVLCTMPVMPTTMKATRNITSFGPMNMVARKINEADVATATSRAGPVHCCDA